MCIIHKGLEYHHLIQIWWWIYKFEACNLLRNHTLNVVFNAEKTEW